MCNEEFGCYTAVHVVCIYIEDWKFKGISSHTSRPLSTFNILVKHKEQSVIIFFCEIKESSICMK